MNSLKIITDNIPQIYPYNKKANNFKNLEMSNNKPEENRMALTQRQKSTHFFIDDSLSKLREFIKTPKPYIISKPIRQTMKYMKMKNNKLIKNFHMSSIKASSARITKNKFINKQTKGDCLSNKIKSENKKKKLKLNGENFFLNFQNNQKINKSQQNNNKNNVSKKILSNISNINTNYSSIRTEEFSKGSHNIKYIFNFIDKIYDESDPLGYKNFYVKDPFYTENGILKNFLDNVNDLRKDAYRNYYLKLNEFKANILYENKLSQIQLNQKNHNLTKYYLDKYTNGFNIYWYKLNKELKKESENIDVLEYEVKEIKMQINKLSNKIQKVLIKINDVVIMRKFLEEIKTFCSFKLGTPYYKLLECKEEIMKKVRDFEKQTNYIRYILNDKDVGVYSFIENNKDIFNNKDIKNIIISQINEVKEVPLILNFNIKSLLMEEHYLEKDIDALKYKLSDLLKGQKENQYYEKILFDEYIYCAKRLAQIKTENECLIYKRDKLENQNKNNKYGHLNKNLRAKILQIIKFLNINKYITEEENNNLHEIFLRNKTKYFIECMYVIEKKINLLLKFKEEVINTNEELKQLFKYSCKIEDAKRKKMKEINEKYIKEQNIFNRINKMRYINKIKKDFFYINRTKYLKNKEKMERKNKREKNEENNNIYPAFKEIMKII